MVQIDVQEQRAQRPSLPDPVLLAGFEQPFQQPEQVGGWDVDGQHVQQAMDGHVGEGIADVLGHEHVPIAGSRLPLRQGERM